ncbi:MAG: hypothetical protein ACE5IR_22750 [bacterium]
MKTQQVGTGTFATTFLYNKTNSADLLRRRLTRNVMLLRTTPSYLKGTKMFHQYVYGLLILVLVFSFTACTDPLSNGASEPLSRSGRVLGIDVGEVEGINYDQAVDIAKAVGTESVSLSLNWDDLESAPGKYNDPNGALQTANVYYPTKKLKIDLFIRPVDTDGLHVPADLQNVSFDDEVMAARFRNLLDFVFSKLPDVELNFLAIGNEVDLAYPADSPFWEQYDVFYRTVKDYAKQQRPNLQIGASGTLYGLIGDHRDVLERLNQHSDVVLVSYYPLNDDFTVKNPSVIPNEVNTLTGIYQGRTIYFSETGYPSSPLLNSSEELQSQFIKYTFKSWDAHASQIRYISFAWLHDVSEETLTWFSQYYGSSDKRFLAYLATLGLRTRDGRDKPAFETLGTETRSRGWR